jgi:peptidoglycan hydrolase CwlO-like protein
MFNLRGTPGESENAHHEPPHDHAPNHEHEFGPDPESPEGPSPDRVLEALTDMEARLRELRGLEEQRCAAAQDLASRLTDVETRERQLDEAGARLEADRAEAVRLAGEAEGARAALADAERALAEREDAAASRERELDERWSSLEARETEARERAESAAREAATAREDAERARRDAEGAGGLRAERDGLAERLAEREGELEKTRGRIEALESAVRERQAALDEAGRALAERAASGRSADAWNERRRARLRRARTLIQDDRRRLESAAQTLATEAAKVRAGREVADQAARELERAREEREAALRTTERAEAKLQEAEAAWRLAGARRARGGASLVAAGLGIGLAAAAGIGWWAAGLLRPPTYEAAATLAASEADVAGDPDAARQWTWFLAGLPEDPQFLDRAASRMRDRGIDRWAAPTDLRRGLGERLDVDDDGAGRLTLRLQGEGAGPTERALATLATAMMAYANDTRVARADGAATVLASASKASSDPIADERLAMLAITGGGAAGVVILVWLIAWGSLSRACASASLVDELSGAGDLE